jgi:hypothetical protein
MVRDSARTFTRAFLAGVLLVACEQPYRIGEYVLVEWEEGSPPYPAYITERSGKARFRVHYDGYGSRWDQDVTIERIKGRVPEHYAKPPTPKKVRIARGEGTGKGAKPGASAEPIGQYKVGDRVKVKWRGSVYSAVILSVVSTDQYRVHYDGHESAWDEVVKVSRIVSTR